MSDTVSFTLSKPFSANAMWAMRRLRSGYRNLSTDYRKWRDKEGWNVRIQTIDAPRITCLFDVAITLPPTRMDADNTCKPILDLAQHVGLISNDRNARDISIQHDPNRSDVLVVLTLRPDLAPRSASARKPVFRAAGGGSKPTVEQIAKARRAGAWKS